MIDNITIKNFKSIKSLSTGLNKLNILTGLNGIGKSSFIQSLLLARQSYFNNENFIFLILNGDLVNLGIFEDIVYLDIPKSDSVIIGFEFTNKSSLKITALPDTSNKKISEIKIETQAVKFGQGIKENALLGENFQYINAERIGPRETHISTQKGAINRLGANGIYAVQYLSENWQEDIPISALAHINTQMYDEGSTPDKIGIPILGLQYQVNKWLQEFSPSVETIIEPVHNSDKFDLYYIYRRLDNQPTQRFKPQNVGFGISYVLSVLVAILSAQPDSLIIIENPEAHLHPSGQSRLGHLCALAARNGVQIIIETHSDHIINGVRVAIREFFNDKKDNIQLEERRGISHEDVNVLWFNRNQEEFCAELTKLDIKENGKYGHVPKGFFDQMDNDLNKILGFTV